MKRVLFLTHIQEISDSSLGQGTGYLDMFDFPQYLYASSFFPGAESRNRPRPAILQSFPVDRTDNYSHARRLKHSRLIIYLLINLKWRTSRIVQNVEQSLNLPLFKTEPVTSAAHRPDALNED